MLDCILHTSACSNWFNGHLLLITDARMSDCKMQRHTFASFNCFNGQLCTEQLCTGKFCNCAPGKTKQSDMWCDDVSYERCRAENSESNILQHFAMFCNVSHCFAMFCNVLQCFRMVTFNVISWAAAWGGQRTFGSKICDLRHFGSFGKQDNQCIHILVSALAHLTMYYRVVF